MYIYFSVKKPGVRLTHFCDERLWYEKRVTSDDQDDMLARPSFHSLAVAAIPHYFRFLLRYHAKTNQRLAACPGESSRMFAARSHNQNHLPA
jgi:hypothetical protein